MRTRPDPLHPIGNGRQIGAARALAGISQERLAELTGYSARTVRAWESAGPNEPTMTSEARRKVSTVFRALGVALFRDPYPGVMLIELRSLPESGSISQISSEIPV
jgi:transcriptional regulator with XRE-family HTH domain